MEKKKSVQVGSVNLKEYRDVRNSGIWLVSPETAGSKNLSMGVGFLASQEEVPSGSHDSEEALYIVKGSGVLIADGQETRMKTGTAVYIPPNVEHSIKNTGKTSMIFLVSETKASDRNVEGIISGDVCLDCGSF